MGKAGLLAAVTCLFFCACHQMVVPEDKVQDSTVQAPGSSSSAKAVEGCYRFVRKRDTVRLRLRQQGRSLEGEMVFDNYQMDSSHGPVKGSLRGDTLLLWYNFQSEGMHSVMQLFFLQTPKGLLSGFGPRVNRGDTSVYEDFKKVYFNTVFLEKVACEELANF